MKNHTPHLYTLRQSIYFHAATAKTPRFKLSAYMKRELLLEIIARKNASGVVSSKVSASECPGVVSHWLKFSKDSNNQLESFDVSVCAGCYYRCEC